jgi:transcriptional regulator with XRE-family HTH domain
METFEAPSRPLVDERQAAFSRLVARIIDSLNEAVEFRACQGISKREIADKIGIDRSSLSRALNGASPNLTLRTISEILWACHFEPKDFEVQPIEGIRTRHLSKPTVSVASKDRCWVVYETQEVNLRDDVLVSHPALLLHGKNVKVEAL